MGTNKLSIQTGNKMISIIGTTLYKDLLIEFKGRRTSVVLKNKKLHHLFKRKTKSSTIFDFQ
jgi:hypothetical protein